MTEVELTRASGDRRLYALEGVGTLRLQGLFSRSATAEAGPERWRISHPRFWAGAVEASDSQGATVGAFEPRSLRRGGRLRWDGRELMLRPASSLRERYALADGDSEIAILDGKGWGRRPVKVTVQDGAAIDPGLLLFASFVVHGLAANAGSDGSVSATFSTYGG